MLFVRLVARCLLLLVTKPRQHSTPPPYIVEIGMSTTKVTAAPAIQRFCAVVSTIFFARQHAMRILSISAAATKPGNTRSRVEEAMATPERNGRSFFMKQMLAIIANSQSMRRYAPPVHQYRPG